MATNDEKDLKYKEAIENSAKALASGQFSLDKVCPSETILKLQNKDGVNKEYRIEPFSLLAKKHFILKYGLKEFVIYLNETPEIMGAEVVYYLGDADLKKDYPTDDDFLHAFPYAGDNMRAVMTTFQVVMGFAGKTGATEAEVIENTDDKEVAEVKKK